MPVVLLVYIFLCVGFSEGHLSGFVDGMDLNTLGIAQKSMVTQKAPAVKATQWDPHWDDYKFADAFKGWVPTHRERPHLHQPFIDFDCDKYPGSILCEYRAATKKYLNFDVLAKIIAKRAQQAATAKRDPTSDALCPPVPRREDIVVHLRLGDVMGHPYIPKHLWQLSAERLGQRCFEEGCGSYVPLTRQTLDRWQRGFPNLFTRENRTFVIVAAVSRRVRPHQSWFGFADVASKAYLTAFRAALAQRGCSTILRTNCLPDADIVYMGRAHVFAPSGGGFSHMLGKLVERSGGVVLK